MLLPAVCLCADSLTLDQIQFKATHNSYDLPDPPRVQIDKFDVWEIELDFGIPFDSPDFEVGHSGPKPRHHLSSLGDWVRNALSAESLSVHPLIIKLEAKTTKPCSPFRFPSFQCADNWDKDWQLRLRDSLKDWIGDDRWITPQVLQDKMQGNWPSVKELAGKVIVTLQDSNGDRDIEAESDYFFPRDIPKLRASWPPISDESGYIRAAQSGFNRLTMDGAYRRPWTARLPKIPPEESK